MTPRLASSCLSLIVLCHCNVQDNNHKTLTVYVSADEQIARKVFTAFTDKTGIDVAWVGDTESSKNTSLVQRLIREKDRPVADVFWSSEILGTLQLAQKKVLTPCLVTALEHWPEQYRDSSYTWYGFSPRARVIAFDPNKTSKESLPKFWWEYSNAAMADPRFGTTSTHVAVMAMFPKKSSALFGAMQRKPMIGGNSATVQAVIDGVVPFAMTDSDDVHAAIERGASVDMFMPRHHEDVGGGTLLIPNTVGIVQGSKKIELAESFVTFLLSEEVAILLASSTSHNIPIQPTVAKLFPDLVVEDPLVIDFYEALAIQEEQIAAVMDVMTK